MESNSSPAFSATDYAMMAAALRIAEQGRGLASPNPHVGCVIVKQGRIIGSGFTQSGGRPHAEAVALAACAANGCSAEGATVYVTLEPCSLHPQSRGPACADLLIAAKVGRVVSALHDPFDGVDGAGHNNLRASGIQVETGLMAAQASAQLKAFLKRVTQHRPWVTLKVAASMDGKTALLNGESKWITGEDARRDVHLMRSKVCAVMTGIGTALADDPALTVRNLPGGNVAKIERQPLRILLDSRLDVRNGMKLLQGGNTLIVTATGSEERAAELSALGVEVMRVPTEAVKGKVDLKAMMKLLAERTPDRTSQRLNHIMVETGAKMNGSLLESGVVDEIVFYLAPGILGDAARGLFAMTGLQSLRDKIDLKIMDQRMVGADIRITAQVVY